MPRANSSPRGRILFAALIAVIGAAAVPVAANVGARSAQARPGSGVFNAECPMSHRGPDDPIVHPKAPGRSHLHDFLGNKSTNASTTHASLRSADTTCHRKPDRSAYWIPTLYDKGKPLNPNQVTVYYRVARRDPKSIQSFPADLRVIAGEAAAREEQTETVIHWECAPGPPLEKGSPPENSLRARELRAAIERYRLAVVRRQRTLRRSRRAVRRLQRAVRRARGAQRVVARRRFVKMRRAYRRQTRALRRTRAGLRARQRALELYLRGGGMSIPVCQPDSRLRLLVRFPDCWDGRNLDSADHHSHMTYAAFTWQSRWRECPSSHPVPVPKIDIKVRYPTSGGPDVRLSAGDVDAGHADFMNGWDQQVLSDLVKNCLNADVYCGRGDRAAPGGGGSGGGGGGGDPGLPVVP